MGFFSWVTSDTKRSIANCYSSKETFPVYLLLPEGGYIEEPCYEGYGRFGGHDVYALVAKWNRPEQYTGNENFDRNIGISIGCSDEQNASLRFPIKLVENKELRYEDVEPSNGCPEQGYFYSDDIESYLSGSDWDDEEDYEDDEEDYEEE